MLFSSTRAVFIVLFLATILSVDSASAGKRNLEVPEGDVASVVPSDGRTYACYDSGVAKQLKRPAKQDGYVKIKKYTKKTFTAKARAKLLAAKKGGDKKKIKRMRKKKKARVALFNELDQICSGGSDDGDNGDPASNSLDKLDRAMTAADVRHLAEVAGYGLSPSESFYIDMAPQGVSAVVDSFMTTRDEAADFESTRVNLLDGNLDEELDTTTGGLSVASTYAAINTKNGFAYKAFQFLLELDTITIDTFSDSIKFDMDMMKSYHKLLLDAAESADLDYKQLYSDINHHPAMLRFLDGDSNRGCDSPNENVARENHELFGIGTHTICQAEETPLYTEDDVVAAALALTGLRIIDVPDEGGESPANHCDGPHTLYAGTADEVQIEDVDDFVELAIFGKKAEEASMFLAKQIALFYVSDDPDCGLISGLAQIIRDNNFKLKPALKTLFESKAFYSTQNRVAKGVFDYVTTSVRVSGIPYSVFSADALVKESATRIHEAPTVFNYFPADLTNDAREVSKINFAQNLCRDVYEDWDPADSLLPSETPTAVEAIDHIASVFNVSLSLDQRLQLLDALNSDTNGNPDLFDPANPNHIARLMTQVCAPIVASPQSQLR